MIGFFSEVIFVLLVIKKRNPVLQKSNRLKLYVMDMSKTLMYEMSNKSMHMF